MKISGHPISLYSFNTTINRRNHQVLSLHSFHVMFSQPDLKDLNLTEETLGLTISLCWSCWKLTFDQKVVYISSHLGAITYNH